MLFEDTYLTISKPSEGIYKEKGSKFIAFAFPVKNEDEIKQHLQKLKKEHPAARHHCYAYRLGFDKLNFRANDDGEPSNTAGKPILGQIQSKDLTNVLTVVVRYFGGTLLGVGGLITAYKEAAKDAIQHANIIEKTINDIYEITFDYLQMNDIMKLIKDHKLQIISQTSNQNCIMQIAVRKSKSAEIHDKIKELKNTHIKYLQSV